MRDIKFRAYQKEREINMSLGRTIKIPGAMYYETQEDGEKLGLKIGASIHNAIFNIGLLNETLMQFIGFKDKNGKERIGRRCEVQRDWPCHERTAPIQSVQVELDRYARVFHNHLLKCSSQRSGSVLLGLTGVILRSIRQQKN